MSALTSLKSVETGSGIPVAAIIVSKDDLATARDQASYVSRCLHRIENLSELDWEEMNDLCRSIHQTEALLQRMLEAADGILMLPFITRRN